MTFNEAVQIAKDNPGQGIREARMLPKWKVVWINWRAAKNRKAGGSLFCINPVTGGDYEYRATEADKVSTKWRLSF
jgi:hypothetical protein